MEAFTEDGHTFIKGASNPWRLMARIRKYCGLRSYPVYLKGGHWEYAVMVPNATRDQIERVLVNE